MEKSVAMTVAMNEVLQDASKTGNSLKSISAGLSGLTVSAKDGTIQLTKSGKALKEIAKIDVWNKKTGEVKDMYTVMDELANKYDDLSEAERTALGTAIAGKTQLNAFNALLSNWETARQYVQDYKDGLTVGSAERENEKYLDSINGKWNKVKENMKSIGNTLITSDMVKGFLSGLEIVTSGMDSLTKKGTSFFSDIIEGQGGKTIADGLYGVLEDAFSGLGDLGDVIASTLSDTLGLSFDRIFDTISKTSHIGKAFSTTKDMLKALNIDLGEDKKLNNQIEERQNNINAINNEIKALKNQQNALESILPRYDELSKKTNRTAQENQELADIRDSLASTNSDLILGYNDDGAPILKNLQLQNKQYENQIKMKQQSLRLEENLLAIQAKQRQEQSKDDYSKNLDNYNGMLTTSDTSRKKGLFGSESLKEYAQRIIKENEALSEKNNEIYQKRLEDHQQYVNDERAIQEKYLNQMESSNTFKSMSDDMQSSLLTFMDSLDWSQFSEAQATSFTNQLGKLGDKFVSTTEGMGEHSKAIQELTDSYVDGQINLTNYTKGLTEQYESARKFDAESFTTWRNGLQSYIDTTGDLEGATKEIDRMATSLNKITGIGKTEWTTALMFDPAPIDANNQALQKFLNTYRTGVQNIGKGGLADKLTDQFSNLQTSYMQLTQDLASGQEIDIEYLVNATVGNPDCVKNLVQELISDGDVSEQDIELLMNVQSEILNKGQITEETYQQIADILDMDVQDVKVKLNAQAEITGIENLESQLANWKNLSKEEKKNLFVDIQTQGFENFQLTQEEWNNLSDEEKQLLLRQLVEGVDYFKETINDWDSLTEAEKEVVMKLTTKGNDEYQMSVDSWNKLSNEEKEQILKQKTEGINRLKPDNEYYQSIKNEEKEQTITQKSDGSDDLKTDNEYYQSIPNEKKEQTLTQKTEGSEDISVAQGLWNTLFGTEEKKQTLIQEVEGSEEVKTQSEYFKSLSDEQKKQLLGQEVNGGEELKISNEYFKGIPSETREQVLTQLANGTPTLGAAKDLWDNLSLGEKVQKLVQKVLGKEDVENASNSINNLPEKKSIVVEVVQSGKNLLDSISNWVDSLTQKNKQTITVEATIGKVDTSALTNITISPIKINADTTSALGQINSLKTNLSTIQAQPINITANTTSALSQVNAVKSALNSMQNKNITINANGNALVQINSIKSALASIQSKTVGIAVSVVGGNLINTLKSSIASLQGKNITVTVTAQGEGSILSMISAIARVQTKGVRVTASVNGTSQVNALTNAINRVKSKSVKITATVSGTGAVNSLANAIGNVRSKTVRVNVNRTVTTSTVNASPSTASISDYTPSPSSLLTTDMNMLSNVVSASDVSPINVPVTASASSSLNGVLDLQKILPSLDFDISHIKELEEVLTRLGNQLEFLEEKAEATFGQQKIDLLQQQIPLLRQQQKIQEDIAKNERNQNKELSKWLNNQGFVFNDVGDITNYNDKLLSMEKNVESLKKKYDTLNDASTKNESAINSAKNAYDNANETLATTKKYLEEYFNTNNEEIIEASKKWWEYENAIKDAESAIRELFNSQLQREIQAVSDEIDFLDAKVENLNSKNKIQYLEQQNDLYKRQQNLLHQLAEQMRSQLATLNPLSEEYSNLASEIKGLSTSWWDLQDAMTSNLLEIFDEQSRGIRTNLQQIEDEIDFLDSKMDNFSNEDRNQYLRQQIDLYQQQQGVLHELAEELRRQLTLLDPQSEAYAEIQSEIKGLSTEWWNVESAIRDVNKELQDFEKTTRLNRLQDSLEEVRYKLDRVNDRMDLLDETNKYTTGKGKIDYLQDKLELLNEKLDISKEEFTELYDLAVGLQQDLWQYGFQIDENGLISNYDEILNSLSTKDIYEQAKESADKYMSLMRDDYIENKLSILETENAIKDIYQEQLEVTKEVESEITKILEKEHDRRTKELEEYYDKRIKMLEKEKAETQAIWEQQDYDKSVNESVEEIAELQRKISVLSKDDSINGKKQLQSLLEQLEDAEKELADKTTDKIRDDFENNIDKEIESLENEQEKILKFLDEEFSEENVAKMVAEAMSNGFIEINGEVQTLQEAMLNSINDSADAYSAMSEVIKNELITNLNVALETMNSLTSIYENLELQDYGKITADIRTIPQTSQSSVNNKAVTFGDTVINISGNVDSATLEQIEELIKEENEKMLSKLSSDL